MDQKLKQDWIEALRSGKYKQGRLALYEPYTEAYCCLGVLCKVAGKDHNPEDDIGGAYDWMLTVLPKGIQLFTDMNDREDKTFNEIADYIEANL